MGFRDAAGAADYAIEKRGRVRRLHSLRPIVAMKERTSDG